MKICALAFNTFLPDVRIYKEAISLAEAGHEVTILALANKDLPSVEYMGKVKVIRVNPAAGSPKGSSRKPSNTLLERLRRSLPAFLKSRRDSSPSQAPQTASPADDAPAWRLVALAYCLQIIARLQSLAMRVVLRLLWLTTRIFRRVRSLTTRILRVPRRALKSVSRRIMVLYSRIQQRRRAWQSRLVRLKDRTLRSVQRRHTMLTARLSRAYVHRKSAVTRRLKQVRSRFNRLKNRVVNFVKRLGKWITSRLHHTPVGVFKRQYDFSRAITPYLDEIQPDLIHSHDLLTLYAGVVASRRLNSHLIYDAHEMEFDSARVHRAKFTRVLWRLHEAALIGAAQRVVTVSPRIAELYRKRYRIEAPIVLPNVPFSEPTFQASGGLDLRASIRDGANKVVLLYIGNVAANRGVEESLQALSLLPERFVLATMGNASAAFSQKLNHLAAELAVEDRFYMFPPVPYRDVSKTAAAADIGLIMVQLEGASYQYCMPNKLFELMHAGLPLVVGRLPDVEHVVLSNTIGIACDQTCPFTLAKAIQYVHDNRQVYRPDRDRLRQIQTGYCWEAFSPELTRCYARLASLAPSAQSQPPIWTRYLRPFAWKLALGKADFQIHGDAHQGLSPPPAILRETYRPRILQVQEAA